MRRKLHVPAEKKKRKAATAGLIERLRKCCGIGTGEWKRTKGMWQPWTSRNPAAKPPAAVRSKREGERKTK
jgi:hypothetical protein